MKKKKQLPSSLPYFFGSVILIGTAIVATAILNRASTTAPAQDIRARASVTSLMRLKAIVVDVDATNSIVTINGLQFTGVMPESLERLARNTAGEWTVNVGGGINLSALSPGVRVELQVNPSSFNIGERSLTAAAITVSR